MSWRAWRRTRLGLSRMVLRVRVGRADIGGEERDAWKRDVIAATGLDWEVEAASRGSRRSRMAAGRPRANCIGAIAGTRSSRLIVSDQWGLSRYCNKTP